MQMPEIAKKVRNLFGSLHGVVPVVSQPGPPPFCMERFSKEDWYGFGGATRFRIPYSNPPTSDLPHRPHEEPWIGYFDLTLAPRFKTSAVLVVDSSSDFSPEVEKDPGGAGIFVGFEYSEEAFGKEEGDEDIMLHVSGALALNFVTSLLLNPPPRRVWTLLDLESFGWQPCCGRTWMQIHETAARYARPKP